MPMTRDQISEQKWAARWRAEADRCAVTEAKLDSIEALCVERAAAARSRGYELGDDAFSMRILAIVRTDQ